MEKCNWEWIFGFTNTQSDGGKVFDIHPSYKFNPVIIQKSSKTDFIRTAFMRRNLADWEQGEKYYTEYPREQVIQFSPNSRAILEIQSAHDLQIIEKIYSNSILLGDQSEDGWGVKYSTEFHMTNDSKLFPHKTKWEEWGYRPDEYSRWIKGPWKPIGELWRELNLPPSPEPQNRHAQPPYHLLPIPRADIPAGYILSREMTHYLHEEEIPEVQYTEASGKPLSMTVGRGKKKEVVELTGPAIALPLYEGRMIGQFDFSQKGWVSGSGRSAEWREIPWESKQIEPQYLMGEGVYEFVLKVQHLQEIEKSYGEKSAISESDALNDCAYHAHWKNKAFGPRVGFMDVGSATNMRSMIATCLHTNPSGNSVPILNLDYKTEIILILDCMLNSFVFDAAVRAKLTGLHLNYFVIEETPLISPLKLSFSNT